MDRRFYEVMLKNQMLATACHFDMMDDADRKRSNIALQALFLNFVYFLKPKCFVEVGAFQADASVNVRTRDKSISAIALEANPHNYAAFKDSPKFSELGIDYRHLAASDRTGTVEFYIRNKFQGVERPLVSTDNSILPRSGTDAEYVIARVPSVALADMLGSNEFLATDFCLWIDVEGASREVLTGAAGVLDRVNVVFIEVEEFSYWSNQWLADDVVRFMLDHNFIPVARDFEYVNQYNIVFIKENLIRHFRYSSEMGLYFSRIAKKTNR